MKLHKPTIILSTVALLALLSTLTPQLSAAPLGTTFTYQGNLVAAGTPASGLYDLKFTLHDALSEGNVVAGPLTNAVSVSNGLFTATLDFGGSVFTGDAHWLEIGVRTTGSPGDFTTLSPRQPLTPTPYALFAANTALLNGQVPSAFAPASGSAAYVAKSGDTMTGTLAVPTDGLQAGGNQLVLAGGHVGIGTTNPITKLDVAGTVRANQFQGPPALSQVGESNLVIVCEGDSQTVTNYNIDWPYLLSRMSFCSNRCVTFTNVAQSGTGLDGASGATNRYETIVHPLFVPT